MAVAHAGSESARSLRKALVKGSRTVLVSALVLVSGCSDDQAAALELGQELEEHEELPPGRHAQIHVLGELDDTGATSPAISAAARFAVFHGMDDTFAKSRINLSAPALDRLSLGQCARSGSGEEMSPAGRAGPLAWRDLNLIDAGEVTLHFAGERFSLDYALAPDLVIWMSGVEYRRHVDALPLGAFDRQAPTPIHLSVAGAAEEELPPFGLGASLPPPADELRFGLDAEAEKLELTWSKHHSGRWPLLLRVRRGDASLECVVADSGRFELDAQTLQRTGLVDDQRPLQVGEELELIVNRHDLLNVAAGVFEEIDIILETQLTTKVRVAQPQSEN